MDHFAKLVAVALLAAAGGAHAFATPPAPPGFGGSPGAWTYTPPTPAQQLGGIMRGPGPSIAGSGPTSAAYRLGAGAARALARVAITGTGAGALALGAVWLADNCITKAGGSYQWTCAGAPSGQTPPTVSTGYEYVAYAIAGGTYVASADAACKQGAARYNAANSAASHVELRNTRAQPAGGGFVCYSDQHLIPADGGELLQANVYNLPVLFQRASPSCPAGWYITPAGCVFSFPPVQMTPQEVEDEMATKPLPVTLPSGVPYPIELPFWNPVLNPDGTPKLDPNGNPQRAPFLVPQGNPQQVPNSEPPAWRQPVTTVTPAPTPSDPWRADVDPGERITSDPQGLTGPTTQTGEGEEPAKPEDPPSLCEQHPEILACADLDTPESGELETKEMGGPITPDSGWGASNAACPAAKHIVVQGRDVPIPFDLFCTYMSGIRPIILAMAWLAAAFIFVGGVRSND